MFASIICRARPRFRNGADPLSYGLVRFRQRRWFVQTPNFVRPRNFPRPSKYDRPAAVATTTTYAVFTGQSSRNNDISDLSAGAERPTEPGRKNTYRVTATTRFGSKTANTLYARHDSAAKMEKQTKKNPRVGSDGDGRRPKVPVSG